MIIDNAAVVTFWKHYIMRGFILEQMYSNLLHEILQYAVYQFHSADYPATFLKITNGI